MTAQQPLSALDTFRGIRRVLWITMGLNLLATAAKLAVGYLTGSLSLIADGLDSVFDSASNIIGLVGIAVAARPADARHPYGHRKAETLTALIIAMLLFLTTWELVKSAVERLRNPALITTEVTVWSFAALAFSMGIHLLVVWYELREGRRLHSDVLVADALHTRADLFVSLAVMVGLVFVRLGFPLADPLLALVVAALIGKIGVDIIRQSLPTLMDEMALADGELTRVILSVPGVVSCHRVRARGHEMAVYADLHIRVDPAMSAEQAHAIAHEVERRVREHSPSIQDVTIHVEPATAIPQETTQEEITLKLRRLADGLGLGVHNVWAYQVEGHYFVEVHLEADGALTLQQAHQLASTLEERARAEIPHLREVTTHIEPRGQLTAEAGPRLNEAEVRAEVQRIVTANLGRESHHLQVRPAQHGWDVSLHYTLPGEMSLADAHQLSSQVERALYTTVRDINRVVVHTEPQEEADRG